MRPPNDFLQMTPSVGHLANLFPRIHYRKGSTLRKDSKTAAFAVRKSLEFGPLRNHPPVSASVENQPDNSGATNRLSRWHTPLHKTIQPIQNLSRKWHNLKTNAVFPFSDSDSRRGSGSYRGQARRMSPVWRDLLNRYEEILEEGRSRPKEEMVFAKKKSHECHPTMECYRCDLIRMKRAIPIDTNTDFSDIFSRKNRRIDVVARKVARLAVEAQIIPRSDSAVEEEPLEKSLLLQRKARRGKRLPSDRKYLRAPIVSPRSSKLIPSLGPRCLEEVLPFPRIHIRCVPHEQIFSHTETARLVGTEIFPRKSSPTDKARQRRRHRRMIRKLSLARRVDSACWRTIWRIAGKHDFTLRRKKKATPSGGRPPVSLPEVTVTLSDSLPDLDLADLDPEIILSGAQTLPSGRLPETWTPHEDTLGAAGFALPPQPEEEEKEEQEDGKAKAPVLSPSQTEVQLLAKPCIPHSKRPTGSAGMTFGRTNPRKTDRPTFIGWDRSQTIWTMEELGAVYKVPRENLHLFSNERVEAFLSPDAIAEYLPHPPPIKVYPPPDPLGIIEVAERPGQVEYPIPSPYPTSKRLPAAPPPTPVRAQIGRGPFAKPIPTPKEIRTALAAATGHLFPISFRPFDLRKAYCRGRENPFTITSKRLTTRQVVPKPPFPSPTVASCLSIVPRLSLSKGTPRPSITTAPDIVMVESSSASEREPPDFSPDLSEISTTEASVVEPEPYPYKSSSGMLGDDEYRSDSHKSASRQSMNVLDQLILDTRRRMSASRRRRVRLDLQSSGDSADNLPNEPTSFTARPPPSTIQTIIPNTMEVKVVEEPTVPEVTVEDNALVMQVPELTGEDNALAVQAISGSELVPEPVSETNTTPDSFTDVANRLESPAVVSDLSDEVRKTVVPEVESIEQIPATTATELMLGTEIMTVANDYTGNEKATPSLSPPRRLPFPHKEDRTTDSVAEIRTLVVQSDTQLSPAKSVGEAEVRLRLSSNSDHILIMAKSKSMKSTGALRPLPKDTPMTESSLEKILRSLIVVPTEGDVRPDLKDRALASGPMSEVSPHRGSSLTETRRYQRQVPTQEEEGERRIRIRGFDGQASSSDSSLLPDRRSLSLSPSLEKSPAAPETSSRNAISSYGDVIRRKPRHLRSDVCVHIKDITEKEHEYICKFADLQVSRSSMSVVLPSPPACASTIDLVLVGGLPISKREQLRHELLSGQVDRVVDRIEAVNSDLEREQRELVALRDHHYIHIQRLHQKDKAPPAGTTTKEKGMRKEKEGKGKSKTAGKDSSSESSSESDIKEEQ